MLALVLPVDGLELAAEFEEPLVLPVRVLLPRASRKRSKAGLNMSSMASQPGSGTMAGGM